MVWCAGFFYFIYAQCMPYFFSFFYLCCVFAVRAGGLWPALGPPAVSLRRLLCLAVVLVACRASVAGSFGSCRACGQLSASSGWFWGSFCFGSGGRCGRFFPSTSVYHSHAALGLWLPVLVGLPGVWASTGCCSSGSSWAGGVLVASAGPQVAGFRVFLVLRGTCGQPLGSRFLVFAVFSAGPPRCLWTARWV